MRLIVSSWRKANNLTPNSTDFLHSTVISNPLHQQLTYPLFSKRRKKKKRKTFNIPSLSLLADITQVSSVYLSTVPLSDFLFAAAQTQNNHSYSTIMQLKKKKKKE